MLLYHQTTLTLAGLSLETSANAIARVEARERALGIRLPEAVREWYALDAPPALMGLGDNQDWPYGIADLGKAEYDCGHYPAYSPLSEGYLVFMTENQSVVRWAVQLNGSDDPPVLVEDERPTGGWHHHADRFSAFVYTRVWDYQTMFRAEGCRVEGGGAVVDAAALASLRQHYQEWPGTGYWPCETTHRFSSSETGARILVGNSPLYGPKDNAYNYVWADGPSGLEAALRDVLRFGGTLEGLWSNDDDERAGLVLEKLRQELSRLSVG